MKLTIKTRVNAPWKMVAQGFTKELFMALNPPFPPVELVRFDGCKKGDVVSLMLNFIFFKQTWESLITKDRLDDDLFEFVDVGVKLPFFLRRWHHTHIIQPYDSGTVIIDDISYGTGTWLTDVLLFPVLYGQFLYRKPIYKRVFKNA